MATNIELLDSYIGRYSRPFILHNICMYGMYMLRIFKKQKKFMPARIYLCVLSAYK